MKAVLIALIAVSVSLVSVGCSSPISLEKESIVTVSIGYKLFPTPDNYGVIIVYSDGVEIGTVLPSDVIKFKVKDGSKLSAKYSYRTPKDSNWQIKNVDTIATIDLIWYL